MAKLTNVSYREALDNTIYLVLNFAHRSGSGADVGVKAFVTEESVKHDEEIGHADISIDGKKSAKLLDIFVKAPYRNQEIGDRMLKLLIDFIKDGVATEICGDITGCNNLHKTSDFFTKHGFTVIKQTTSYGKHTIIEQKLTASKFSEFFELHTVEKIVGNKSIPM